jgi:Protein of unknown function (DUF2845)
MNRSLLLFTAMLVAATAAPEAGAATLSFRCKNDLVNVGDGKASALQKCGQPVFTDSFCKPVVATVPAEPGRTVAVGPTPCETVDEWTYNPGYGQFMTTLRFESGRLVTITYGDRVK